VGVSSVTVGAYNAVFLVNSGGGGGGAMAPHLPIFMPPSHSVGDVLVIGTGAALSSFSPLPPAPNNQEARPDDSSSGARGYQGASVSSVIPTFFIAATRGQGNEEAILSASLIEDVLATETQAESK
jgi:hypothetical protein